MATKYYCDASGKHLTDEEAQKSSATANLWIKQNPSWVWIVTEHFSEAFLPHAFSWWNRKVEILQGAIQSGERRASSEIAKFMRKAQTSAPVNQVDAEVIPMPQERSQRMQ